MTSGRATVYGGQAILEGVLIRGTRVAAMAVRTRDGIAVLQRGLVPLADRWPALSLPLLRGAAALWEALSLGLDALFRSADLVAADDGDRVGTREKAVAVAVSLLLVVGLFFVLPTLAVRVMEPWLRGDLLRNLAEAGIRLVVLLGYVAAIGMLPDIRRVLQYHGAEHKVIHALEAGDRLTVDRVRRYPRLHPRCGTSFLLQVVLVSALLFGLFGWPVWWQRLAVRLLLLPVVAGIAYEVIRASARGRGPLWRAVAAPGLWLQQLTTREPDDDQIEVAIRALEAVRVAEDGVLPCGIASNSWSSVITS